MKNIKFSMNPYKINIKLRKRITEVCGNSATGKSFIYELFKSYETINKTNKILCLDTNNAAKNKLEAMTDGVIIIDYANHVLNNKEIAKFIISDYQRNNHYLLFGRNLCVTSALSELAEPDIKGNEISLTYLFED